MFGQACTGLAGTWSDDYGYIWSLTQSGFNVSGTVDVSIYCGPGATWNVSGSEDANGNFTLAARPGTGTCTNNLFTYSGNLSGIGCESGSGEWQNDVGGSGTWNWSKPCDGPDSETTSTSVYGWGSGNTETAYQWSAIVVSDHGLYFGGRTVSESDAGFASDSCYFQGSTIDQFTAVPNNSAVIDNTQSSTDLVGWTTNAVTYYRIQRPSINLPMPCNFNGYANEKMSCSSAAPIQYSTDQLSGVIDVTTVQSWRQGQSQTRTW